MHSEPRINEENALSRFAVILAAAGKSSRFGNPFQKKVFSLLAGKPVWMHAAEAFSKRRDVAQLIMVIAAEDQELFQEKYAGNAAFMDLQVVVGGAQRADSVRRGLEAVRADIPYVAIHDAARPCVAANWIDDVFAAAEKFDAAILALPCSSTLKLATTNQTIEKTVPRQDVWLAQTPQVFKTKLLIEAYAKHPNPSSATDDAAIVEGTGVSVKLVEGSPLNIKVTTQADLKFAELALKGLPKSNPFPF
jgi:2-C-methyl-D-erythritol 4-phosphate cytidylyltransferase